MAHKHNILSRVAGMVSQRSFNTARTMRDVQVLTSLDPGKMFKRFVVNKFVLRRVYRNIPTLHGPRPKSGGRI